MAQESRELEKLQTRVSELEAVMRGLKIAATILGVSGAVIGAGLFWAGEKAVDAAKTARDAKTSASTANAVAGKAQAMAADAADDVAEASRLARVDIEEATASAKDSLATYFATATFTPEMSWEQGQPPTRLGVRKGRGICFLTRVIGAFTGGGEWVATSEESGEYVLIGASQKWAVGASARCLVLPGS